MMEAIEVQHDNYLIYSQQISLIRGGFRGVSEVSRNHSGFSLDDGYVPFRLQHFTRHTQRAE